MNVQSQHRVFHDDCYYPRKAWRTSSFLIYTKSHLHCDRDLNCLGHSSLQDGRFNLLHIV